MTEKEFYEALSNLKYVPLFGACNRIRFTSGKKNALLDLCPITAVLMSETGEFLHSHKYLQAANKLGLEEEFAEEVASGADNRGITARHWPLTKNGIEFCTKSNKRRGEIIEALGMGIVNK